MKLIKYFRSTNRVHLAWYLYDFGNSACAAVILLAIYSAYFKGEVVGKSRRFLFTGNFCGNSYARFGCFLPCPGSTC